MNRKNSLQGSIKFFLLLMICLASCQNTTSQVVSILYENRPFYTKSVDTVDRFDLMKLYSDTVV